MNIYNDEIVRKTSSFKCYLLIGILMCGFGIGLFFLIQSLNDPQRHEVSLLDNVIDDWEKEYPHFLNTSVEVRPGNASQVELLKNFTDPYVGTIQAFPVYKYLSYTISTVLFNSQVHNITKSNGKEYNITTDLEITLESNDTSFTSLVKDVVIHTRKFFPVNAKVCRINSKGYWDHETSACYYRFNTIEICIVVNSFLNVSEKYTNGCDNKEYFKQENAIWTTAETFEDYDFKTIVQIRSEKDPFVFANYNNLVEFSLSSREFFVLGVTILTISTIILIVPVVYLCNKRRKRSYLQMSSHAVVKDVI